MDWSWKVSEVDLNPALRLRYEPGNWGDVIKGVWVELVGRALAETGRPWTCLDPFAGAPSYPLLEPVARRLAELPPDNPYRQAQQPWLQAGRLASAGSLLAAMPNCRHLPFDQDEQRRGQWPSSLELTSGEQALDLECDLLLWDPYDFSEGWPHYLDRLLARSQSCCVLIYVYNRAVRGVSQARQYQALRQRLGVAHTVGRIGADERLPRAYHEMWLLDRAGRLPTGLRHELEGQTRRLAGHLAERGAFESTSP